MEAFWNIFLAMFLIIIVTIILFGIYLGSCMMKEDKKKTEAIKKRDEFQCFGKDSTSKWEADIIVWNLRREDKKREKMRRYSRKQRRIRA